MGLAIFILDSFFNFSYMLGHFAASFMVGRQWPYPPCCRQAWLSLFLFHHWLVKDAVNHVHVFYNLGYLQPLEFSITSFAPKPFSTCKLVWGQSNQLYLAHKLHEATGDGRCFSYSSKIDLSLRWHHFLVMYEVLSHERHCVSYYCDSTTENCFYSPLL